ncbi:MAG: histidine kinase N-terminal 7TM domain-containing protein [Anaerolineales bacterium]|jgi:hypothetical protein
MVEYFLSVLIILNKVLVAGIAITAFSLLLYALTFNLRDRVARAFAVILACVSVITVADVLASTAGNLGEANMWLHFQWIGTALLPAAYLHFSDALLAAAGRPSRGRRRSALQAVYFFSAILIYEATLTDNLVRQVAVSAGAPYLQAGPYFWTVLVYFTLLLAWTAVNLVRAYRRLQTSTSRRRMTYLLVASAAPAMAAFPFLLFLGSGANLHPLLFWAILLVTHALVAGLLVVMAYATAYFGVTYSDRVIKGRLFQWLLRGPVVAVAVLAVTVLLGDLVRSVGIPNSRAVPLAMVATLLLLQFAITLFRVPLERLLFYGSPTDREDLRRLQMLEERLLTHSDMQQFFEVLLAGVCDVLSVPAAFVVELDPEGKVAYRVGVGPEDLLPIHASSASLPRPEQIVFAPEAEGLFRWGDYWILPLLAPGGSEMLGMLGMRPGGNRGPLTREELERLGRLAERAAQALEDRRLQATVFSSVDRLVPEVDRIQRLSAAARYGQAILLAAPSNGLAPGPDLFQWVRDALTHYWGGPKLTQSPLLQLRVVQQQSQSRDGNEVNALRAVLKEAIERVRPEGERRFTSEWLLYNILEMKFLEGRRVRDIATHLAVSEADLYRKQRVALEEVSRVIADMERQSTERATDYEVVG